MSDDVLKNSEDTASVPLDMLWVGMTVPHDIFTSDGKVKLVAEGIVLDEATLHRLVSVYGANASILVSKDTELYLKRHGVAAEHITNRKELEENTNYGEMQKETENLLEKTRLSQEIDKEAYSEVSDGLIDSIETVEERFLLDIINAIVPEDEYLQRHSTNVALLNGLFAKWLELTKDEIKNIVLIGLLHDCGKTRIPSKVLNAQRKLSDVEFEVIKMHPLHSYNLLSNFPEEIRLGARGHHEKVNGYGYPDGLKDEKIPVSAKIGSIIDIYDAMVSQRVYKPARSPFAVLSEMQKLKDHTLDAKLVDLFVFKLPNEFVNKPVVLSDDTVGLIQSIDINHIEYPMVIVKNQLIQTDENLYVKHMYIEDE